MQRLIHLLLLLTPLVCYLEWGTSQAMFLFEIEYDLFASFRADMIHPMILIPFLGQLLLLFSLFQKRPNRKLALIGMLLQAVLVLLVLLGGILSLKTLIILSTLPFILTCVWFLRTYRSPAKVEIDLKKHGQS